MQILGRNRRVDREHVRGDTLHHDGVKIFDRIERHLTVKKGVASEAAPAMMRRLVVIALSPASAWAELMIIEIRDHDTMSLKQAIGPNIVCPVPSVNPLKLSGARRHTA